MKIGQHLRHQLRPEWGVGQVEEVQGNKISVNFEFAGPRRLDLSIVRLELAVDYATPIARKINVEKLEALCERFQIEMQNNRSGTDDGGMARVILADVKRRGEPTESHKKRLLDWCHTDGPQFQTGVSLAREICVVIYGRILPDPDKDRT